MNRHEIVRLSTALSATLDRTIRNNNAREALAINQSVRDGIVVGSAEITGAGESIITIEFPALFVSEPIFTSGFVLGPNQWLTQGAFPSLSAAVADWVTTTLANNTYYGGAVIGVLVDTTSTFTGKLHYCFQAQSLSLPAEANLQAGETL